MNDDNLKTWPEKCYLQHDNEHVIPDYKDCVSQQNGNCVNWWMEKTINTDIEYIRADVANTAVQRAAEEERMKISQMYRNCGEPNDFNEFRAYLEKEN